MAYTDDLYQQVILDHNKNPRNFRPMDDCTHVCPGHNPLCGDHITVFVKTEKDIITDLSFEGSGCAISKASASMMTEAVLGLTVDETKTRFDEFHKMLLGELDPEKDANSLGKLKLFAGVAKFSSRVKCAGLAWHALSGAIDKKDNISTEEED